MFLLVVLSIAPTGSRQREGVFCGAGDAVLTARADDGSEVDGISVARDAPVSFVGESVNTVATPAVGALVDKAGAAGTIVGCSVVITRVAAVGALVDKAGAAGTIVGCSVVITGVAAVGALVDKAGAAGTIVGCSVVVAGVAGVGALVDKVTVGTGADGGGTPGGSTAATGRHRSPSPPARHEQIAVPVVALVPHELLASVSGPKHSALELHDPHGPADTALAGSPALPAPASVPLTRLHRS
jgi:hypothetical protein